MADKDERAQGGAVSQPGTPAPGSPGAPPGTPSSTEGDIHTYIGNRLRQAFDDVAKQPVPDRFLDLMAQLDKA